MLAGALHRSHAVPNPNRVSHVIISVMWLPFCQLSLLRPAHFCMYLLRRVSSYCYVLSRPRPVISSGGIFGGLMVHRAYASNGGWDNTCGNKARLTSLTLRYLGTNVNDLGALRGFLPVGPDGTQKQPDSKLEITSPGPNHVSPVTISNGGGLTVTPNSVSIGSTFTLSGSFPGDLTMQISHGSSS
jgi:hypothetical protein